MTANGLVRPSSNLSVEDCLTGVATWLHDVNTRCFHFEEQGWKTLLGKFTGKIIHFRLYILVT